MLTAAAIITSPRPVIATSFDVGRPALYYRIELPPRRVLIDEAIQIAISGLAPRRQRSVPRASSVRRVGSPFRFALDGGRRAAALELTRWASVTKPRPEGRHPRRSLKPQECPNDRDGLCSSRMVGEPEPSRGRRRPPEDVVFRVSSGP